LNHLCFYFNSLWGLSWLLSCKHLIRCFVDYYCKFSTCSTRLARWGLGPTCLQVRYWLKEFRCLLWFWNNIVVTFTMLMSLL
jgi:hypothetical protein